MLLFPSMTSIRPEEWGTNPANDSSSTLGMTVQWGIFLMQNKTQYMTWNPCNQIGSHANPQDKGVEVD